ncbi:transposase, partial [Haemophilus influenzae]
KVPKKTLGQSALVALLLCPSCGGAPISIIRQYIEQQQTPD